MQDYSNVFSSKTMKTELSKLQSHQSFSCMSYVNFESNFFFAQVKLPAISVYPASEKQLFWWLTRNCGFIFTCSFSPCVLITLHLVWVFKHFNVLFPQCFIPFLKCFQFGETPNVFLPHFLLFNLSIFQRKLQPYVSVSLAPPFKIFSGIN